MTLAVIHLHADAPAKPPAGQPCNGCGLCCALEPCPLGALASWRRSGRCDLLRWDDGASRYRCGALQRVARIPVPLDALRRRLASRWIAAGEGCDCTAQPAQQPIGGAAD